MNSSSFDQILRQVLIVPLLVILIGAGALAWQMHHANQTVAQIQKADQTIAETLLIERLIDDQETGLRGYQTTSDPNFLQPYRLADQEIPSALQHARETDPIQQQAFTDLQTAYATWQQGFAEPLIQSIRAGAQTSDVDLNLIGKRYMDDIRKRLSNITIASQQRRENEISRWRTQVRLTSYALILIAAAIGLVIGLYTRRQLQDVSSAFRQSHNILRIRAEQTFRSEQKLRTTLQSIADGVIPATPQDTSKP